MAGQRELSFDEDKPVDYVAKVISLIYSGDYIAARKVLLQVPVASQRRDVVRTVAAKTGIHL